MTFHCRCYFVALGLVLGGLTAAPAAAQSKNILFFGNSLTFFYDMPTMVGRIAQADGYALPNIVSDTAEGVELDRHITRVSTNPTANVTHSSMTAGKTWDYVVFNGRSQESTHLGDPVDFVNDSLTLYRAVKNHSSGKGVGVKAILYQTWARAPGHAYYPTDFTGPAAMMAEVRATHDQAIAYVKANEGPQAIRLSPVGEAFASQGWPLDLYNADRQHPSYSGSLLAAMINYNTIYGEQVSNISYGSVSSWANVTQTRWTQLAGIADATSAAAVPEPSCVTIAAAALGGFLLRRRHTA